MTVTSKQVIESLGLEDIIGSGGRRASGSLIQTKGGKAYGTYFISWDLQVPPQATRDEKMRAVATTTRVHIWQKLKDELGCFRYQYSLWVITKEENVERVRTLFMEAEEKMRAVGLDATRWQIIPVITSIEVQEAIGKNLAEGLIEEVAGYFESYQEAMDLPESKRDNKLANLRRLRRHLEAVMDLWGSESKEFKKIDAEIRKQATERMDDLKVQIDAALEELVPPKKE